MISYIRSDWKLPRHWEDDSQSHVNRNIGIPACDKKLFYEQDGKTSTLKCMVVF